MNTVFQNVANSLPVAILSDFTLFQQLASNLIIFEIALEIANLLFTKLIRHFEFSRTKTNAQIERIVCN